MMTIDEQARALDLLLRDTNTFAAALSQAIRHLQAICTALPPQRLDELKSQADLLSCWTTIRTKQILDSYLEPVADNTIPVGHKS